MCCHTTKTASEEFGESVTKTSAWSRVSKTQQNQFYLSCTGCAGPEVNSFIAASKKWFFSVKEELGQIHGSKNVYMDIKTQSFSRNQRAENLNWRCSVDLPVDSASGQSSGWHKRYRLNISFIALEYWRKSSKRTDGMDDIILCQKVILAIRYTFHI